MYGIFADLTNILFAAVGAREKVKTDHTLFRLQYRISGAVVLLAVLMYTLVICTVQGISCVFPHDTGLEEEFISEVCWVLSVYTLTNESNPEIGEPVEPVKIASSVRGFNDSKESVRYHTYYQGVPYILLGQLLLFIGPRYIWYCWEDGKMKMMQNAMYDCMDPEDDDERQKRIKMFGEHFMANLGYNNTYGYAFAFCELLNLAVVFMQIHFLDVLMGYAFSDYGSKVLEFTLLEHGSRSDPMVKTFPLVGKCSFNIFGPSGSIIPHSGICSLPLNLTSERYFVFMWLYLSAFAIMDILNLIFRLLTILSKPFRLYMLCRASPYASRKCHRGILRHCQYGDWFILFQLSKNLDGPLYFEVMEEIYYRGEGLKNA